MKQISFKFPTKMSEIEPFAKKIILSYDHWATFFFGATILAVALGYLSDSSQSDQRWTVVWGISLFLWSSFLVLVGKSADAENRRWWLWMLIAFFLPIVALIAIIIFKTSPDRTPG